MRNTHIILEPESNIMTAPLEEGTIIIIFMFIR